MNTLNKDKIEYEQEQLEDFTNALNNINQIGVVTDKKTCGELMQSSKLNSEQCTSIIDKIVEGMKEGVDFETLPECKKPTFLIPGADKFCFQFNFMAKFEIDHEMHKILDLKNFITLKCLLIDRETNKIIGEGRGAAQVGQGKNSSTINSAIKMAEIRAKRDAVLNTFPLRDRFTQDMETETEKPKSTISIDNNTGEVKIL